MKVKMIDMEEGALRFFREVIATMPTTGHKFLGGLMAGTQVNAVENALRGFADEDGNIDTDAMRKVIQAGFSASGDKVSFTISDPRLSWLVKPVTVTITPQDLEKTIASVEAKYA